MSGATSMYLVSFAIVHLFLVCYALFPRSFQTVFPITARTTATTPPPIAASCRFFWHALQNFALGSVPTISHLQFLHLPCFISTIAHVSQHPSKGFFPGGFPQCLHLLITPPVAGLCVRGIVLFVCLFCLLVWAEYDPQSLTRQIATIVQEVVQFFALDANLMKKTSEALLVFCHPRAKTASDALRCLQSRRYHEGVF